MPGHILNGEADEMVLVVRELELCTWRQNRERIPVDGPPIERDSVTISVPNDVCLEVAVGCKRVQTSGLLVGANHVDLVTRRRAVDEPVDEHDVHGMRWHREVKLAVSR